MADVVGEYDEILAGIEQLASAKQLPSKSFADELRTRAAGPVHDQHRGIARLPVGSVVKVQFRQRFTAAKLEVSNLVVPFHRGQWLGIHHRGIGDTESTEERK